MTTKTSRRAAPMAALALGIALTAGGVQAQYAERGALSDDGAPASTCRGAR